MMRPCTIVIPVYNSFPETVTCLRSVLKHTPAAHRIVVIDDASPDGVLADFLPANVLSHPRIELQRNPENLGFVRTCNLGIRNAARSDVVLLNSDTEVTAGWLSQLRQAAYSGRRVGTATPLTNNGDLCSVPEFMRNNPLPPGYTLDEFAALVREATVRAYPPLPTCVGFCVYIKRELLDAIGPLDAENFDRGYGEENDLSCRARAAGWQNVLDDATFVLHRGRASFGALTPELNRKHLQVLERKYPGYTFHVQQFIAANPLEPVQRRIREALVCRWNERARYRVLHLLHHSPMTSHGTNLPGGIEYHVADLAEMISEAAHWSFFGVGDAYYLRAHVPGVQQTYRFAAEGFDLGRLLDRRLFDVLHLHHASKFPYEELAAALGRHGRYFVSLHDFALCCPNVNLVTREHRVCNGGQCESGCGRPQAAVDRLRATTAEVLRAARTVLHFSQYTRTRYAELVGDGYRWQCVPHGVHLPAGGLQAISAQAQGCNPGA